MVVLKGTTNIFGTVKVYFIAFSDFIKIATINVEPCGMLYDASRVVRSACVPSTIVRPNRGEVQIADNVSARTYKLRYTSVKEKTFFVG